MDESYYYLGGKNLYEGNGFSEEILWNFLDDPEGIPHPSHLYWMPFNSILAAGGMFLFRSTNYLAGSFFFILLAAIIPCLTYSVSWRLSNNQSLSLIIAGFSIVSGYYFSMLSTIDSFSVYMLLGTTYLLVVGFYPSSTRKRLLSKGILLGLLAGLMHFTRADGILWIFILPFVIGIEEIFKNSRKLKPALFPILVSTFSGLSTYFLVMSGWYIRNLRLFNSLTVSGSSLPIWMRNYNELFSYPSNILNYTHWIQDGLVQILETAFTSLINNLGTFLGVNCFVILLPFIIGAIWKRRELWFVQFGVIMFLLFMGVMSFIFPFAGVRGGFLHSGSAFQIFFWTLGGLGIYDGLSWMEKRHNWNAKKSSKVFGVGLLIVFSFVTIVLAYTKIQGNEMESKKWTKGWRQAEIIDAQLSVLGIQEAIILINDPPTFNAATGRPAIVIPDGDQTVLFSVMNDYDVNYFILEENHPAGLQGLYKTPENSGDLIVLFQNEEFLIFEKKGD
ncbi:MAG: hypothetical protein K8R40_07435 [Anaerolineaceae bacterium]|nr:hypothetical protein [Anaerolineaceae bacterium]